MRLGGCSALVLGIALGGAALAACEVVDSSPPPEPSLPSAEQPAGMTNPGQVRVLTYNTYLMFDTTCDSGACGPGDFERVPSQEQFVSRNYQVAEGIELTGADAICLQEVENVVVLDALHAVLDPRYTTTVMGETGFPASIDVAVVAAMPLLEVRRHRDRALPLPDGTTTTFARELLEVHLRVGEGAPEGGAERLILFCAHFRSKVNDDGPRRLAEATAAREIVDRSAAEFPEALVVLAGDLNDTPGSPPLQALMGPPGGMARVAEELAPADHTWGSGAKAVAIDHLLVPVDQASRFVTGSARIFRGPTGGGFAGSDHSALAADFTLP